MRGREPRGIQFLSILFGSVDTASAGIPVGLYSFGSAAAVARDQSATELLSTAELPDASADGATRRSGEGLRAVQLNQRGQGDSSVVGGACCGDRGSVYLFVVVAFFAG
jgi:hypothetical protein